MQFRRGKPYKDPRTGRWIAVWYIGTERRRERTQFTEKADVEALLEAKEGAFIAAQSSWAGDGVKVTVEQAVVMLMDDKMELKPKTRKRYQGILDNFSVFHGDRDIDSVSYHDVDKFIQAHRETEVEAATLASDLRVLKILANWCKEEGLTDVPFTLGAKKIKVPRKRKRYLNQGDIAAFIAACSPVFRPIAVLAIFTGLRQVEIINLKWSNIEVGEDGSKVLWAKGAKTEDDRCVPLHPLVVAELKKVKRISEYIFPVTKASHNRTGRAFRKGDRRSESTCWFNHCVKKAARDAGLDPKKIDVHGLRKTFARLVQRTGGDLWLTGTMLGHREVSTTQMHYLFDDDVRARAAVDAIDIGEISPTEPDEVLEKEETQSVPDNVIEFSKIHRRQCHTAATRSSCSLSGPKAKPPKPSGSGGLERSQQSDLNR